MGNDRSIRERIDYELSVLVGQPMWECNRALNMQMFELGPRHAIVNRKGQTVEIGRYALHVQCPWRMVDGQRILFSQEDRHYPPDHDTDCLEFDSDKSPSLLDTAQRAWFKSHSPLTVLSATGDPYGGCRLELVGGFVLECLPLGTRPDTEYWRLFDTVIEDVPHFVVQTDGVRS